MESKFEIDLQKLLAICLICGSIGGVVFYCASIPGEIRHQAESIAAQGKEIEELKIHAARLDEVLARIDERAKEIKEVADRLKDFSERPKKTP